MDNTEEDLNILKKETQLSHLEAEKLLQSCEGDVVSAILKHQGDEINGSIDDQKTKDKAKPLTIHQQKIQELRNIVDQKDEMMDQMIQKQKAK